MKQAASLLTATAAYLAAFADAQSIEVVEVTPWVIGSFSDIQVNDGTRIIFTSTSAAHAVSRFASLTDVAGCSNLGNAVLLDNTIAAVTNAAGNSVQGYEITVTAGENGFPNVGESFGLFCPLGNNGGHCTAGMRFQVSIVADNQQTDTPTVSSSPTSSPTTDDLFIAEWAPGRIFQPQEVFPGQDILFDIGNPASNSNVAIVADEATAENCNLQNVVPLDITPELVQFPGGVITNALRVVVTPGQNGFPESGDFFAVSTQGTNFADCRNGQRIQIIQQTDAPTFSPTTSSPTTSPTFSPTTGSPTQQPTAAPIQTITTSFFWGLPQDSPRGFQASTVTENEELRFTVFQGSHNIKEFPNRQDFDNCNFDNALDLGVDITDNLLVASLSAGEERFFGCNKTTATGQVHCELGQKLDIKAIKRNPSKLSIQWFKPGNADEVALFAKKKEILVDQVFQFNFDNDADDDTLFQFVNKAAFDACAFNSASAIFIQQASDTDGFVLYHDLYTQVGQTLYFGSNVDGSCEAGQKIAVDVVAVLGQNNGNDGNNDEGGIGAGAIVGALIVVGILIAGAIFITRRKNNNAQASNVLSNPSERKYDVENVGARETPAAAFPKTYEPAPMPQSPVQNFQAQQRQPEVSMASTASSTQSLARSKAALSGLNF